ncbi:MAG TPA: hypothetical protein DEQ17_00035 [Prevotella sp.]|nr:hypothetical protein [Prevotella sp.]
MGRCHVTVVVVGPPYVDVHALLLALQLEAVSAVGRGEYYAERVGQGTQVVGETAWSIATVPSLA